MKNFQEAEGALKKAIEMQPLWPAPHTNLANLYLLQGRKKEAVAKFEAAINANPRDPSGYLSLALLYERDKDYRQRHEGLRARAEGKPGLLVRREQPGLPAGGDRNDEGGTGARQGAGRGRRQDAAERAVPSLDTLGWVYFRMGDTGQARGLIEQALAAAPEADVLNYHMGAVLVKARAEGRGAGEA